MDKLINKLFPPKCLFCQAVGSIFCENCLSGCQLVRYQKCIVCDKPAENGITHFACRKSFTATQFISIFEYSEKVRECIKMSKYNSRQFLALKILTKEALNLSYEWSESFPEFTCVPIPLAKNRYRERGFNQAYIIAKILSSGWKIPVKEGCLLRIRGTKAQHLINREERFKNILGSFKCDPSCIKGGKFLLIDDISTTGATFREASKVLYESGALEVKCFALSKKL